jgi:competence protein ComEC
LIGYKEDLDKEIVKSYSNTGVVHIIAISGLHLGLIYLMLVWLLDRMPLVKRMVFIKAVVIIAALWIFSLVTGASASVLRSAVMFTCIVTGKSFQKQSDIRNSLAASAFILLCYNPFFIFDVGFQLSYLAIISIVSFQKSVHRLVYCKNNALGKIWDLLAVTLAAQLLTFPICLYYFHQFPNYFFLSNLIAVPLSTIILFLEIFLLAISPCFAGASFIGITIDVLVRLMNQTIEYISDLPYSLWDNIYADGFTTTMLYLAVVYTGAWLIIKRKTYFYYAILAALLFTGFHSIAGLKLKDQKKIIVYNFPKQQAIDFIYQDKCFFYGDATLKSGGSLHDIKLKACRTALQIKNEQLNLTCLSNSGLIKTFFGKKIMIVDSSVNIIPPNRKIPIDLLIISKNPNCSIAALTKVVQPAQIIFDASNSLWKISKWKKECEAITLPCFSTAEKGAFIYNIN